MPRKSKEEIDVYKRQLFDILAFEKEPSFSDLSSSPSILQNPP